MSLSVFFLEPEPAVSILPVPVGIDAEFTQFGAQGMRIEVEQPGSAERTFDTAVAAPERGFDVGAAGGGEAGKRHRFGGAVALARLLG